MRFCPSYEIESAHRMFLLKKAEAVIQANEAQYLAHGASIRAEIEEHILTARNIKMGIEEVQLSLHDFMAFALTWKAECKALGQNMALPLLNVIFFHGTSIVWGLTVLDEDEL